MRKSGLAALPLLYSAALGVFVTNVPARAQSSGESDAGGGLEEVVVTGMRETQRTSIELKRDAPVIVDYFGARFRF